MFFTFQKHNWTINATYKYNEIGGGEDIGKTREYKTDIGVQEPVMRITISK